MSRVNYDSWKTKLLLRGDRFQPSPSESRWCGSHVERVRHSAPIHTQEYAGAVNVHPLLMNVDLELRHLRAFETVARLKSFTAAAKELLITQPALSRTIRQLEAELQVTLLYRSSRHTELTADGELFLGHVEKILEQLDRAIGVVRQRITIKLGFSWLLPDPWAQNAIERFERLTCGEVNLIRSDDPLTALHENKIDVALIRGQIRSSSVRAVHLFDETRVAVCSVKSTVAHLEQMDWREVPLWPLVVNVVSGTTGTWSWPEDERPPKVVETRNFDEWLESIAADRGIGVVPEVAMRRNVHPAVKFIPLWKAPPSPVFVAFQPYAQSGLVDPFLKASVDAVET